MPVVVVSLGTRCQEGPSSSSRGMPPEGASSTAREPSWRYADSDTPSAVMGMDTPVRDRQPDRLKSIARDSQRQKCWRRRGVMIASVSYQICFEFFQRFLVFFILTKPKNPELKNSLKYTQLRLNLSISCIYCLLQPFSDLWATSNY